MSCPAGSGATFLALPTSLFSGRSNTQTTTLDILNQMVADIVYKQVVQLNTGANLSQFITSQCTDRSGLPYNPSQGRGAKNAVAVVKQLSDNINDLFLAKSQTEHVNIDITNGPGFDALQASTLYATRGCMADGINQVAKISVEASANVATTVKNEVVNKIAAQIEQSLSNVRDITGDLGGILSAGSSSCIAADISNRIQTNVDVTLFQNLITSINAVQMVSLRGSSYWISNVSQTISVATVSSLVAKTLQLNKIYNDIETKAAQDLVASNAALLDFVNSIGGTVAGFANVFGEALGQILIAVGAIALLFIVFVALQPEIFKNMLK